MEDLREKYEVVIGLEVHAQLKTKSNSKKESFIKNIQENPLELHRKAVSLQN